LIISRLAPAVRFPFSSDPPFGLGSYLIHYSQYAGESLFVVLHREQAHVHTELPKDVDCSGRLLDGVQGRASFVLQELDVITQRLMRFQERLNLSFQTPARLNGLLFELAHWNVRAVAMFFVA
jgi:hypothetical protein